ncbi:hypothetical protein Tco_1420345 [Tanacetum coccineum]
MVNTRSGTGKETSCCSGKGAGVTHGGRPPLKSILKKPKSSFQVTNEAGRAMDECIVGTKSSGSDLDAGVVHKHVDGGNDQDATRIHNAGSVMGMGGTSYTVGRKVSMAPVSFVHVFHDEVFQQDQTNVMPNICENAPAVDVIDAGVAPCGDSMSPQNTPGRNNAGGVTNASAADSVGVDAAGNDTTTSRPSSIGNVSQANVV